MKKGLVGIAVFLATLFFGIATVRLSQNEAPSPVGGPATEVLEPVSEKPATVENDVYQDNYGGWYGLEEFKGIHEVTMLSIWNSIGDDDEPGAGVFTTFEKYGDQGFVGSAWIRIDGNHVKFGTQKINGVRYRFEGTFRSTSWSDRESKKPLYGTLQKFVSGKKVAEVSGNFKYFEPHCLH